MAPIKTGSPHGATMQDYVKMLPDIVTAIRSLRDTILTNVVLVGQIPAPTFHEAERSALFLERLAEFQVDDCTTDGFNNPIGIIHGTNPNRPPIFLVAHMDSPFGPEVDHNFTIRSDSIIGTGLLDNALGIGVLLSFPEIVRRLDLRFESDIVLAGVIQSLGKGKLCGTRQLLKTWPTPIRGAVCIESGELGRLNYYSDGMIRGEIIFHLEPAPDRTPSFLPNAILIINEVINQIMTLRLPLKPRAKIIFGTIQGGLKHGQIAHEATLGFEIRSDSDDMVKSIHADIKDIVAGIRHEYGVGLVVETITNLRTARLRYNHPLVKSAVVIMEYLGIEPFSEPSESDLAVFLARNIPAVTMGITHGEGYQQPDAVMEIEPMFTGIAQVIGTVMAIDGGVCDG